MEKLRENVVAVEKTLEDRSWRFERNIAALEKTIEKKEAQLQKQREEVRTLHTAVEGLQRQLQHAKIFAPIDRPNPRTDNDQCRLAPGWSAFLHD
jgi:predicted  nucleic acid-binding Zn-ribbon protein